MSACSAHASVRGCLICFTMHMHARVHARAADISELGMQPAASTCTFAGFPPPPF